MQINDDNNALTEVALGLAMAFFAIMVVALVSMSVPKQTTSTESTSTNTIPVDMAGRSDADQSTTVDVINIFYWQGRYFDELLAPLDPAAIDISTPAVLSVPANATLSEAIEARAGISLPNLRISLTNNDVQKKLENLP